MYLKKWLILGNCLIIGFSIFAMEEFDKKQSKTKYAESAQEWKFLYHVSHNQIEQVQRLINEGVNVSIRAGRGHSRALTLATKNNSDVMIKMLAKNGARIGQRNLRKAILGGNDKAAKAFIKLGADVNFNKNGMLEPILIKTVWESFKYKQLLNIVPILVRKGANINSTILGRTAYDYACEANNENGIWDSELLELLKPKDKVKNAIWSKPPPIIHSHTSIVDNRGEFSIHEIFIGNHGQNS